MLLISGGKLSAALAAAREVSKDETLLLPSITKHTRRSKTLSPAREAKDPGREALENKSGLPSSLDVLRYRHRAGPSKAPSFGALPPDESEAELQRAIDDAAAPGPHEDLMTEAEQALLGEIRAELRLFAPDRAIVLDAVRRLAALQRAALTAQEDAAADLQERLNGAVRGAEETRAGLEAAGRALEDRLAAAAAELDDARQHARELALQVEGLEERLRSVTEAGVTAEEVAATAAQLTKSRAVAEALRQQVAELKAKAAAAEAERRQEMQAQRDRHRAVNDELKAMSEHYGPENMRRVTEELLTVRADLNTARDGLRRSKLAQRQQHLLVVEWRVKVDEAAERVREAGAATAASEEESARRAARISELELQLQVREQDARRLKDQAESLSQKLQEYVERYSRQAAQMKAQEALWRAAALRAAAGDDNADAGGGPAT